MNIVLNAVLPTVLLLVLGNLLRRRAFVPAAFWGAVDKLTYFILFPSLLITKVSEADLSAIDFAQVFTFIGGYFPLVSAIAYVVYRLTGRRANQFSSIYQGLLRFNSYVFFAVIESVWGQETLALAALVAGLMIPILNVCCVGAFALSVPDGGRFSWRSTALSIIQNPLIIASLFGFVINHFPVLMPTVLLNTFDILSKAALPLALLSVGAAVRIQVLFTKHDGFSQHSLWLTTIARLIVIPILALLLVKWLGISGDLRVALVFFAAVPTATSSYILSQQLRGDADMMATIISLQTVLSIVSLVLWLSLLMHA